MVLPARFLQRLWSIDEHLIRQCISHSGQLDLFNSSSPGPHFFKLPDVLFDFCARLVVSPPIYDKLDLFEFGFPGPHFFKLRDVPIDFRARLVVNRPIYDKLDLLDILSSEFHSIFKF